MQCVEFTEALKELKKNGKMELFVDAIKSFESLGTPEEEFLKNNAIQFEMEHTSRVFFILSKSLQDSIKENKIFIEAFFTLNPQVIKTKDFPFEPDLTNKEGSRSQAIVIGQIAKYRSKNFQSEISIKEILKFTDYYIYLADKIIPFKIILIETKVEKLKELYEQNGFVYFGTSNGKYQLFKRLFNRIND